MDAHKDPWIKIASKKLECSIPIAGEETQRLSAAVLKVIIPLVSFLDTKGNTLRPFQPRIANIIQQSFEVAFGPKRVNTNPVRSSPAFAV